MSTCPQFALPFAVAGTITINYDAGAPDVVAIASATRYNDRTLATATDAWAYAWAIVDTADTGGTWAVSEPSTGLSGRCKVTRTPSDARAIDTVVFSAGIAGQLFGFDSDTVDPDAGAESITGTWQRQYLWMLRTASAWYSGHWDELVTDVAETLAEDHDDSTRDQYQSFTNTPIEMFDVPGCLIRTSHSDAVAAVDGLLSTDPNVTWEAFLQFWIPTTGKCRFWPDQDALAVYYDLTTLLEGLGDMATHLPNWTKAPLRYDVDVTGTRGAI